MIDNKNGAYYYPDKYTRWRTSGFTSGHQPLTHNTIKDPHRYAVQGSDTTMMPMAASLFGQKKRDL